VKESKIEVESCPFCDYVEAIEANNQEVPPASPFRGIPLSWLLGLVAVCLLPFKILSVPLFIYYTMVEFGAKNQISKQEPEKKKPDPPEFRCQNRSCFRVSCRMCKLDAHAPASCNDAAQASTGGLEGLRLAVENAMAEALVRTCPQCGLNFLKKDGCNKMS